MNINITTIDDNVYRDIIDIIGIEDELRHKLKSYKIEGNFIVNTANVDFNDPELIEKIIAYNRIVDRNSRLFESEGLNKLVFAVRKADVIGLEEALAHQISRHHEANSMIEKLTKELKFYKEELDIYKTDKQEV